MIFVNYTIPTIIVSSLPVNLDKLLEEHDASGAVAFGVKGWRPSGKAHHVWHNHQYYEKTVNIREDASCSHTKKSFYQDDPTDTRFSWKANFECKLTAVVVHSLWEDMRPREICGEKPTTAVHEAEHVLDGLTVENPL